MAKTTTPDVEATVQLALGFLEETREELDTGLSELIAVQELLLALAVRGALPADPLELLGYLRPILCSNRREQEDFPARFSAYLRRRAPQVPSFEPPPIVDAPAEAWRGLRRRSLLLNVAAFALIAGVAVFAMMRWYQQTQESLAVVVKGGAGGNPAASGGQPVAEFGGASSAGGATVGGATVVAGLVSDVKPPPTSPPAPPSRSPVLPLVGFALVVAAVLGSRELWARRRAEAYLLNSRGADEPGGARPDAETLLLQITSPPSTMPLELKRVSALLRTRTATEQRELDLARSMLATAERGGFFFEVLRERTKVPEYVFFLERRNPNDFVCARHEELLTALSNHAVRLRQFYFEADASVLLTKGARERPRLLHELEGNFTGQRIGIFAEPSTLFDPITRELAPWFAGLLSWTTPVVFTSSRRDLRVQAVARLDEVGVQVVEASSAGFLAACRAWQGVAALPEAPSPLAPLPSSLHGEGRVWLAATAPETRLVDHCLEQLRAHLGKEGYLWFSACAVYPQLRWPLAAQLGRALEVPLDGASNELVRRLCGLPWMRAAWMPGWLRRRLLMELAAEEREAARRALEQVLLNASLPGDSSVGASVYSNDTAEVRAAVVQVSRGWKEHPHVPSPLEDELYVAEMQDELVLRVPRAVRSWRQAIGRQARINLPVRDAWQCVYGAFFLGYMLQLLAAALPGNASTTSSIAALVSTVIGYGALSPQVLALRPSRPRWAIFDAGARGFTLFASILGACAAHIDFNFGAAATDPNNVAIVLALLVCLGLPLALFDRWLVRGIGVMLVIAACVAYKVKYPDNLWDVSLTWWGATHTFKDLTLGAALAQTERLLAVSAGVGILAAVGARFRPSWLSWHDLFDRFAVDRWLLDRSAARPLPASRLRTAIGALGCGLVFGTLAGSDAWKDLVIWARVLLVGCGLVFVMHPHLAARRYRQREGIWAELRAGWELALLTACAVVALPSHSSLRLWLPAVAVASWALSMVLPKGGSERLRVILERLAPDRLLATSPHLLGAAYAAVFFATTLTWWERLWPKLPETVITAPNPGRLAASATGGSGVASTVSAGGSPSVASTNELALGGQGGGGSKSPLASKTGGSGGAKSVVASKTGGSGGAKSTGGKVAPPRSRESDRVKQLKAKLDAGGLDTTEHTELSDLCSRAKDGACVQRLNDTPPKAPPFAGEELPIAPIPPISAAPVPPAIATERLELAACLGSCESNLKTCSAMCSPTTEDKKLSWGLPEADALDGAKVPAPTPDVACRATCSRDADACRKRCESQ